MLNEKIAVVTGGAKEIGRTISLALAEAGMKVAIVDVDEKSGMDTVEMIRHRFDGDTVYYNVDISQELAVKSAVSNIVSTFGSVSALVNNAGIMGPVEAVEDIAVEDWDKTMAVNLRGMFLFCKYLVPLMKQQESGVIVNVSSVSGKRPLPLRLAYATSKMGVIGFTRTLAAEVGGWGIRVNSICPGGVTGERQKHVFEGIMKASGKSYEEIREEKIQGSALKKFVSQQDIANLVRFLCSQESIAITGQDINICCGAVMY